MALRNRNEVETDKLKGVVLAGEEADLEPGRFVYLQNWIPSTINSIKKKRGGVALSTTSVTPTVPTACSGFSAGEGGTTP